MKIVFNYNFNIKIIKKKRNIATISFLEILEKYHKNKR